MQTTTYEACIIISDSSLFDSEIMQVI